MKKVLRTIILCVLFTICAGTIPVLAGGRLLESGTVSISPDSWDDEEIYFTTYSSSHIVLTVNVGLEYWGFSKSEKIVASLVDTDSNKVLITDNLDYLEDNVSGSLGEYSFYSAQKVPAGNYKYVIRNRGKHTLNIKYRIEAFDALWSELQLAKKQVNVDAGSWQKIKIQVKPVNSYPVIHSVYTSNATIADVFVDYKNRELEIDGYRPGKAIIRVRLANGKTYNIDVTVSNPVNPTLKYTSATLYVGDQVTNIAYHSSGKVKWSSSNKRVATVNSKGVIKAKKAGTCWIKAKIGKKTLKCKVKVVRQEPNFYANLVDYNTRNNYFTVKFKNVSNKTLTITSGTKVEEDDYKSFDRKIRLKKKVKIKPNQTQYVKFYVKGRTTWYDVSDFTLFYKFSFDGKTYVGRTWDGNTSYKTGKSWYNTFWDEEFYNDWYEWESY